jgi:hypothetical protein
MRSMEYLIFQIIKKKINYIYMIGYFLIIHPNFYSAQMHIHYLNDNFHKFSLHQFYFTFTELIIFFCVWIKLNKNINYNRYFFLNYIIFYLCLSHILLLLLDEGYFHFSFFFENKGNFLLFFKIYF